MRSIAYSQIGSTMTRSRICLTLRKGQVIRVFHLRIGKISSRASVSTFRNRSLTILITRIRLLQQVQPVTRGMDLKK